MENNNNTEKKKVDTKQKWRKLREILLSKKEISIPLQKTPDLLTRTNQENGTLYQYKISENQYLETLIMAQQSIKMGELQNFVKQKVDSTGIQQWPSEEILAYYLMKNVESYKDKDIIELGAGSSGLASILLTQILLKDNADFKLNIEITDGNETCVEYLQKNVEYNIKQENHKNLKINSSLLVWDEQFKSEKKYDKIIISDCLFFKDFHRALVITLKELIRKDGSVLIVGPKRGNSMELFLGIAKEYFEVEFEQFQDSLYQQYVEQIKKQDNYDVERNDIYFINLKLLQ